MEQELFEKYLTDRYENQINWYDSKSADNKKYYIYLQWGAIVISSLVPVLIAFLPIGFKWFTASIAAFLAVITAGLKTFKFQENWISFRTIAETLKKEKYYFDAELDDYENNSDKQAVFVERVESLISRENSLWIVTHKQKEEDKKDDKVRIPSSNL